MSIQDFQNGFAAGMASNGEQIVENDIYFSGYYAYDYYSTSSTYSASYTGDIYRGMMDLPDSENGYDIKFQLEQCDSYVYHRGTIYISVTKYFSDGSATSDYVYSAGQGTVNAANQQISYHMDSKMPISLALTIGCGNNQGKESTVQIKITNLRAEVK